MSTSVETRAGMTYRPPAEVQPLRILYVEDDPEAREFVVRALERSGFTVDVAETGARGLDLASAAPYDLMLLDVMLPDVSGFEVLRQIRQRKLDLAVVCLTAQGEVAQRVEGLDAGADDYLTKPFAFAELLARIRAVDRRHRGYPDDERLVVADLVLDVEAHRVERAGQRIDLTPKEFTLLEYLLRNAGHVVSRTMITERVWGYGFDDHANVIDVHVTRLRRKMDRGFDRKLIHTVKGVGYVIEDRGPQDDATD